MAGNFSSAAERGQSLPDSNVRIFIERDHFLREFSSFAFLCCVRRSCSDNSDKVYETMEAYFPHLVCEAEQWVKLRGSTGHQDYGRAERFTPGGITFLCLVVDLPGERLLRNLLNYWPAHNRIIFISNIRIILVWLFVSAIEFPCVVHCGNEADPGKIDGIPCER